MTSLILEGVRTTNRMVVIKKKKKKCRPVILQILILPGKNKTEKKISSRGYINVDMKLC